MQYAILFTSGLFGDHRDRDSKCIEGSLRLSDSPDLIAAGQVYIDNSDSPNFIAAGQVYRPLL